MSPSKVPATYPREADALNIGKRPNSLFHQFNRFSLRIPTSVSIIHYCRPFSLHLSSSLKLARLQPIRIKSLRNSSSALALLLTSTQRQTLRNAFNSRESLLGFFRRGVPLVAIRKSAFKGSSFRYGGSDSIISIAIIPRDQMSTLGPYSFCLTTSGAIQ